MSYHVLQIVDKVLLCWWQWLGRW